MLLNQNSSSSSSAVLSVEETNTDTNAAPENLNPLRPEDTGPVADAPDTSLVRRFCNGDENAFVEIMRRYQGKIFVVAQSLLHNHGDAEEITQDTFIRAHRNLPRFRGDSSLATWLHRIAVNLARNRYWYFFRRCRQGTVSLDCPVGENGDGALVDLFSSDSPDPAHENSRMEFSSLISSCMEKLDAHHREILTLRNVQDLSYEEIAQQLKINTGTVKSRIARARERLRARLAAACPEFAPDAAPSEWFEPARGMGQLTTVWI
jgi:RNA polymerase sigma-70 factor (ECF subfamily)